jgi:hypothetical protein
VSEKYENTMMMMMMMMMMTTTTTLFCKHNKSSWIFVGQNALKHRLAGYSRFATYCGLKRFKLA